jgi:uncharacterized Zn finger protein (UPF0148 family)
MEVVTQRECPLCGQPLAESDGFYTCAEHGAWHSYGAKLLVRAPSDEDKAALRFLLPWEQQSSAV